MEEYSGNFYLKNMNKLVKTENQFSHEIFGSLTTITNQEGDVFFIGKEVTTILEFKDSNEMIRRLDEDEFTKLSYEESKPILNRDEKIHSSGIILLTESGLYSAILGSRKPEAKVFKKWVTSEVLPSIRKNGMYATDITIDKMIADPDFAIQLLTNLKEEKALRLEAEKQKQLAQKQIEEQKEIIEIQAPKVESFDKFIDADGLYSVNDAAKSLGVGQKKLFEALREAKILNRENVPYQKFLDSEYFKVKTSTIDAINRNVKTPKVTPKGLHWLRKLIQEEKINIKK
jgi:prophage antirepressor-like protein